MKTSKYLTARVLALMSLLSLQLPLQAQEPTWADDIACIIYQNCSSCHNDEGVGPFSLMSYSDAYNFRSSIRYFVEEEIMPPFPADPEYADYLNVTKLSDAEKQAILDWIDAGAPPGNLDYAADAPIIEPQLAIPDPDMTVQFEAYTSNALTTDDYRCLVGELEHTGNLWIQGLEVIPSNPKIVHHSLLAAEPIGFGSIQDFFDPGPGYACFGRVGSWQSIDLGGWSPGYQAPIYPDGFAFKLAGTYDDLIIQNHYPLGSAGQSDSSLVHIKLADSSSNPRTLVRWELINHYNTLLNGPLFIPANEERTFYARYDLQEPMTVLSVAPHMHLIGSSIEVKARLPWGDTIGIVKVDDWNFEWQLEYEFRQPLTLPPGTMIVAKAVYDNTEDNPQNPYDPPQDIEAGPNSTDEMLLVYFTYAKSDTSDQYLEFEDDPEFYPECASLVNSIEDYEALAFEAFPNPFGDHFQIYVNRPEPDMIIQLRDIQGRVLKTLPVADQQTRIDASEIPAGIYFVELVSENENRVRRLIKLE
jgi:hypothetical protein